MKRFLKTILCLLPALTLIVSCNEQPEVDNNEYYVKYTITSGGTYYYFSDIYYKDVHGTGSAEKGHSIKNWTVTIGPVKRGFTASVRNEKGTGKNQIDISKNNGPFALKATGQNSASYTINY